MNTANKNTKGTYQSESGFGQCMSPRYSQHPVQKISLILRARRVHLLTQHGGFSFPKTYIEEHHLLTPCLFEVDDGEKFLNFGDLIVVLHGIPS